MVPNSRAIFLILVLMAAASSSANNVPPNILTHMALGYSFAEHLYQVYDGLQHNETAFSYLSLERKILKETQFVFDILERQSDQLTAVQVFIKELSHLPRLIRYQRTMDRLSEYMSVVFSMEKTFQQYLEYQDKLNPRTLEDFATRAVGHDGHSLMRVLDYVHDMVVPYNPSIAGDGIFQMYRRMFQEYPQVICDTHQSAVQHIQNLYNVIAMMEIKGDIIMQFSWILLQLHGNETYTTEASIARENLIQRSREKAEVAREVMSSISNEYWRCDPVRHQEGTTFVQLTGLMQGYIENEVDMNWDGSCGKSCSYYSFAHSHRCFKNQFCARQDRCRGDIVGCRYVDSDMTVCLSDRPNRRYEWVLYEDWTRFGQVGQYCRRSVNVDSWWRWIFWHCSYCFCHCDQIGPQYDRYFSLHWSSSDIRRNKVVTAVRFRKVNGVVHIQVQEAEAMPLGGVNQTSWKPVSPVQPSFSGSTNSTFHDGSDYFTVKSDQRGLDLDDVKVPEGYAVTGVRFRKLGGHLNLQVRATRIDFGTGQLDHHDNVWVGNEISGQKEVTLDDPDVPIRAPRGHSSQEVTGQQYIQFTHSSVKKDVAQTTVPFLDAQPVAPVPGTWLAGLGVRHRGHKGFGGFVYLRAFTFDLADHLEVITAQDLPSYDHIIKPFEGVVLLKGDNYIMSNQVT